TTCLLFFLYSTHLHDLPSFPTRRSSDLVFRIAPLGSEIWEKALVLSRQHSARFGTRTLDLLHVAAALVPGPDVFYTFDKRQRKLDRKSTRLNSSHQIISYAVFCLKKKTK